MSISPPPIPLKKSQKNKLIDKSSCSSTDSCTSPEHIIPSRSGLHNTQVPPVPPPKKSQRSKVISDDKYSVNITPKDQSIKSEIISPDDVSKSIDKLESEFDQMKDFDLQLLKDFMCIRAGISRMQENQAAISKKIDETLAEESAMKRQTSCNSNLSRLSKTSLTAITLSSIEEPSSPLSITSLFNDNSLPKEEVPPHLQDVSQFSQNARDFSIKYSVSPQTVLYATHSELTHALDSSQPGNTNNADQISPQSQRSTSSLSGQQYYPPPVPEKKRKKRTSFFTTRAKMDKTYNFQASTKINNANQDNIITQTWPRKNFSNDDSPQLDTLVHKTSTTIADSHDNKSSPLLSNTNKPDSKNTDNTNLIIKSPFNMPESNSSPYLNSILNQHKKNPPLASNKDANINSIYKNCNNTSYSTHNLLEEINLENLRVNSNGTDVRNYSPPHKNDYNFNNSNIGSRIDNSKSFLKRAGSTPSINTFISPNIKSDRHRSITSTHDKKLPNIPAVPLPPKGKILLKQNPSLPTSKKSPLSPAKESVKKRFQFFNKTPKSAPDPPKIEHIHFSQNSSPEITYSHDILNESKSSPSSNINHNNLNYPYHGRALSNFSSSLATIVDERSHIRTEINQSNNKPPEIPPKPTNTIGKSHIVLQQTWC